MAFQRIVLQLGGCVELLGQRLVLADPQRRTHRVKSLHTPLTTRFIQPNAIGGKNHLIEAAADGFRIASQHEHISTGGIKSQFQEGAKPARGREPATLLQFSVNQAGEISCGLPLQKIPGALALQSQHGKGVIPVDGGRHRLSSSAALDTSDRRNRLTKSRSAAAMAVAPPSSRSTIVMTRLTT